MTLRGTNVRAPSHVDGPRSRGGRPCREAAGKARQAADVPNEAESLAWMLEASGLGHWRHETETDQFSGSEGLRAILELDSDDELTSIEHLNAYLHPEDRSIVEQARAHALATTDDFEVQHRFVTRRNHVRWVMVRGRAARCTDVGIVVLGIAIDITAQKEAEAEREPLIAELAAERARLRALVDHLPAAVLVADASGHIVLANPAVGTVFPGPHPAIPVASMELFDAWRARHPDGRPVEPTDRPMSRALHGETVEGEDFRYLRPDGSETWIRIASAPIRGEDSTVTGAVVIAACVDRERRAEEALRWSERRHRQLFDSSVIGIIYSRVDGRITDANDTFLQTFGYTREDLTEGRLSWREMTPPEYRDHDDREVEALRTTGAHSVYEKEYLHKNGTRIPIVLGGTMVEGSSTEVATFVLDIRDRKRIEAERESLLRSLAESEERYRLVALASEDAIYDWDLVTNRVRCQSMFGHGPDVLDTGNAWAALIHPDDREAVATSLEAALASTSRHWRCEYRFRAASGEWLNVVDRGYVVLDGNDHPVRVVGAIQDATARRKQQEFERQLIGIVSHDLRNPLAAILLGSEMMVRSTGLDPRTLQQAKRVKSAGERALRMVRDLLDFTRARLGVGIVLERQPTDLGVLVKTLVDDTRVGHSGRSIVFASHGDCSGTFDADRLTQVVTNLIDNALKYGPAGTDVRVTLDGTGDRVRLAIFNAGAAIPSELLPRLFEPMQRGDPTFDPASRSVGLGLYIVKQLVEAHGGNVQVDSSDAAGTTFTIDLPRSSATTT